MVIYGYLGPEIWFRFGYVKLLGNQVNFSGKKKKKPQQELDFDMKALKQLLHSMKWHHNFVSNDRGSTIRSTKWHKNKTQIEKGRK